MRSPSVITPLNGCVFLGPKFYEYNLKEELGPVRASHERLFLADPLPKTPVWAQDVWFNPVRIKFTSVQEAAAALGSLGSRWALLFSEQYQHQAELIQARLPHFSPRRITFGSPLMERPFGCWTLVDANTIIASTNTYKNAPLGIYEFIEDKTMPPNRAYLKLWEVFTCLGFAPKKGETCIDIGASPGGWTWVLNSLGTKVTAIDKAPLDPKIAGLAGVSFLQKSAFAHDPRHADPVDWVFSDVICYPDRLFKHVSRWLEFGKCNRFVCTIKLQGKTDFAQINQFLSIPGSQALHLYHNKHEVIWVKT